MSLRYFLISLSLISGTALAAQHVVVAPDCLLAQTKAEYKIMASTKKMNLITANDAAQVALIDAKNIRAATCGGFLDVTQDWNDYANKQNAQDFLQTYLHNPSTGVKRQYKIHYTKEVEQLIAQINPQMIWDNLTTLSSSQDRYANSQHGVDAAKWLRKQVMGYAKRYKRNDVSAYFVKTGNSYIQPSLVIKIGNSNEAGIVVGAHMDTLSGDFSKKPGADDDGSGTTTVLEATRTLLSSGMQFKKPIYIIWYAAEEEGLVGSGFVVKDFKSKNIPVSAVIHFDLTGFTYRNDPTIWLITDNVDANLTNYLGQLIKTYVKKPIKRTECGYACSDHATWTMNGYTAAMPAEAAYEDTNPSIHSSNDTIDKLSLEHMTDYTKLAVAFAVELAEPLS